MHPGMAIDASQEGIPDGDRCIPRWRSIHPGRRRSIPGWLPNRCFPGWWSCMAIIASRDGDRSFSGWGWMHRGKAIAASLEGNRCIPGWRLMHPGIVIMHLGMAIIASRDGHRCNLGWRSMHPGMVSAASLDGDRCILIDASRDGDR